MDSGWAQFRVNFSFEPRDEREIGIREGDILLVAKPILNPEGWLTGENTRTGEVGEFPGNYVVHIGDVDNLRREEPTPPPRPPKRRSHLPSVGEQSGKIYEIIQYLMIFVLFGEKLFQGYFLLRQSFDVSWQA